MGVHGTSGSPKWSSRTPESHPKMSKLMSQASQNRIFLMFSNACHTNHQMHVDRGPAAEGVALKIYIDYDIHIYPPPCLQGTQGVFDPMPNSASLLGRRGSKILFFRGRQAPPGANSSEWLAAPFFCLFSRPRPDCHFQTKRTQKASQMEPLNP